MVDSTYSQSKVIDRQVIEIRTIVFPCINVLGVSKVVDRTRVNVPRIAYIDHKTGIPISTGFKHKEKLTSAEIVY